MTPPAVSVDPATIVGPSFVPVIVIVTSCVAVAPVLSATVTV